MEVITWINQCYTLLLLHFRPKIKHIQNLVQENVKRIMSDQLHIPSTASGHQIKTHSDNHFAKPSFIASSSVFGPKVYWSGAAKGLFMFWCKTNACHILRISYFLNKINLVISVTRFKTHIYLSFHVLASNMFSIFRTLEWPYDAAWFSTVFRNHLR